MFVVVKRGLVLFAACAVIIRDILQGVLSLVNASGTLHKGASTPDRTLCWVLEEAVLVKVLASLDVLAKQHVAVLS